MQINKNSLVGGERKLSSSSIGSISDVQSQTSSNSNFSKKYNFKKANTQNVERPSSVGRSSVSSISSFWNSTTEKFAGRNSVLSISSKNESILRIG